MAQNDFCSLFNLTGLDESICQTLEKQPITPNMLYTVYGKVSPNFSILTTNVENIIKQNAQKIFIYDTIFQQLPWIIMFLVLIIFLGVTGVLRVSVVVILIIIMLIVSAIFMFVYVKYNTNSVQNLINDINAQMGTNINNFKKSVFSISTFT